MDTITFIKILSFTLLFFMITIGIVNRLVIYSSFKAFEFDDDYIKERLPIIIAANLNLLLIFIFLIQPILNFITYQVNNVEKSIIHLISLCSLILIISIVLLLVSYSISKLTTTLFIKAKDIYIKAILWCVFNTIITIFITELYNQISSTSTFTIY